MGSPEAEAADIGQLHSAAAVDENARESLLTMQQREKVYRKLLLLLDMLLTL